MNALRVGWIVLSVAVISCSNDTVTGPDAPVRVMTWNIRYDNPGDGPSAWPNRRDRVAELVNFVRPDVVGFQEALRGQVDDLAERLPDYAWVGKGRDDGRDGGEFSPVFYRRDSIQLEGSGTLWLSETPNEPGTVGWDAALPRVASWVEVTKGGRGISDGASFRVVNTHFDHRGEAARRGSAQLLVDSVAVWALKSRVMLIGDFNADPDSAPYQIISGEMLDARVVADRRHGPDETFFGFLVADTTGRSIDHIFVDHGTDVYGTAVLTDHYKGRYLSDHLPVVADVVFSSHSVR